MTSSDLHHEKREVKATKQARRGLGLGAVVVQRNLRQWMEEIEQQMPGCGCLIARWAFLRGLSTCAFPVGLLLS